MQMIIVKLKRVHTRWTHFSLPGGASLSNCRLEYGNGVFYPRNRV